MMQPNEAVSRELKELLEQYKNIPVSKLLAENGINLSSKSKLKTLSEIIIQKSSKQTLKEFLKQKEVQLKTVNLVRGGTVEASLSLPSFNYIDIISETWETSELRSTLASTTFVLIFFEENAYGLKEKTIKTGFIWKMPLEILDEGVRKSWQQVVDCVRSGHIVKYIGDDGRHHTYFPRTSDGPYVHVRPHAASGAPPLPLPVPDQLTGLTEYKMHSFWLTRSYIEKLLYNGGYAK